MSFYEVLYLGLAKILWLSMATFWVDYIKNIAFLGETPSWYLFNIKHGFPPSGIFTRVYMATAKITLATALLNSTYPHELFFATYEIVALSWLEAAWSFVGISDIKLRGVPTSSRSVTTVFQSKHFFSVYNTLAVPSFKGVSHCHMYLLCMCELRNSIHFSQCIASSRTPW